ncbi:MAG: hypothetical protein ACLQVM_03750, partial [Terriglobia bacterium]
MRAGYLDISFSKILRRLAFRSHLPWPGTACSKVEPDYETKKNHVLRFLDEGDKVKATIFFRGREMTRQSLG